MNKAMMYLLLALGITLGVVFVGGALVGCVAGFVDGFYGNEVESTSTMHVMIGSVSIVVLILCVILNWVFLKHGFASYTIGRIPKPVRWKVFLGMIIAMAGMAVVYDALYDISFQRGWISDEMGHFFDLMQKYPLLSILFVAVVEATANLIIYGGVIREILEWKHQPVVIGYVYAVIMGLFTLITDNFMLMLPAMMLARFEAMVYEYTRSVIPIIIGDVAFWVVMLCLLGIPSHGWWIFLAAIIVVPGILLAFHPMEPYKPID